MERSNSRPVRRSARLLGSGDRAPALRNSPANADPKLLQLAAEIRLLIYAHVVIVERPFMIGRVQERPHGSHNGSPRDYFSSHPGNRAVPRDESRNRPVQPAITRTCRIIRHEALPMFYSENRFWLIHNEYQSYDDRLLPPDTLAGRRRGFDAWLSQTPARYFEFMQHITLCGYTYWPTRVMITIDFKARKLIGIRVYSTYGDNLLPTAEAWEPSVHELVRVKLENHQVDCKTVLQSILRHVDWIYEISPRYIDAPPGLSRTRSLMAGWEYDW